MKSIRTEKRRQEHPDLQAFTGRSLGSAEVEARLPLGHEVDPRMSLGCVGDYARSDCGGPELALLRATPSVGMGQHELDLVRHRVPLVLSDFVGGDEERFRRIKQITHEIRKHVDDRLSFREIFAHLIFQGLGRFCGSEKKFPPVNVSKRGRRTLEDHEPS